MVVNLILFFSYFFSTAVVFSRNSLYSIISLIFLIISVSFILFTLKIEFLTFIILLIYIGAINILFLFVVMMLNLDITEKAFYKDCNIFSKNYLFYIILTIKTFIFIYYFNKKFCLSLSLFSLEFLKHNKDIIHSETLFNNNSDSIVFLHLFNHSFSLLIIISFIILFSMFGSIALCLTKNK